MARAATRRNLKRLLSPKSIAVVGGDLAARVIRLTRDFGFAGPIHAVHPTRNELTGVPCVRSIADLPSAPDAVFLGVSREATLASVKELSALGAGGAVCYASGFSEVSDGDRLERDLIASAGDMALIGPNCHGVINGLDGIALWPDEHGIAPTTAGAAIITQSGNIGITLTMQERGLDIAYMLSVGNQAVLKVHDYLDVLADDPRIGAIGLYIEAVEEVGDFAEAVLKCARRRLPIVAIKAGRSEAAVQTALSHTSSLAGSDALVDAFFHRYGIVRVDSLAELVETLKFLSLAGPIDGPRIASLSCSGGDAAMLADLAHPLGLDLAPLPDRTRGRLTDLLGARVAISNPLDYHTYIWGDRERLTACFGAVCEAGYDATMLVHDYPRPDANDVAAWDVTTEAMIAAHRTHGGVGIVVSSLPEAMPAHARRMLNEAGLTAMQGLPECLKAVAASVRLGRAWRRFDCHPPSMPIDSPPLPLDGKPVVATEPAAKALFTAHGIRVPEGRRVAISQASAAAAEIGFPVVVKTAAAVGHKTELGGVALDLEDTVAVHAAAVRMSSLSPEVYVERMLPSPLVELIVGVKSDRQFGPVLVVGEGGIRVELQDDNRFILLPTDPAEIRDALQALRIWPILEGYRGAAGADIDSLVDAISRLATLAIAQRKSIFEIEINPLMVYPAPDGAIAADALVCTSESLNIEEVG
ncbi:MAG: acetate--CoA ligase family protein [Alphaproteobacteria bacterium]|nr:acetate--CoA ligase family protein [Alphaproteobacteria bacterium]